MPDYPPTLGALHHHGSTTFRVWAPEHDSVELILQGRLKPAPTTDVPADVGADFSRPIPMQREACGYWTARRDDAPSGTRYLYRLDGDAERTFPDPASRFQPEGVHGASAVVDPEAFSWAAPEWQPPSPGRVVFYELHVGTFTPEGTFAGAQARLPYLRDLGVTAIEIMPVAEFPGRWNWGYDGVSPFAPSRAYGTPDDLRALVDAAHQHGLAVFMDVVYNHLGPDGAYANAFSAYYFTDRHRSPWGKGVNLDGPHAAEVRRFFIENALHWVREYRVDGLRLDATHALVDEGPRHFLEELTSTVREASGAPVLFVAEDERDLRCRLRPASDGGWGLDGVWADHFHHEVRVHVAHDREGYFARHSGTTEAIARAIADGIPGFVFCIQNHDQVGNRADGGRLHHQIDPAVYRAVTTLLLLAPEAPLLFMGQEWAAATPFQFFTDHHPELGAQVTEGRQREFGAFAAFADPVAHQRIADPQSPDTFHASRLRWEEMAEGAHAQVHRLYRRLLSLRGALPDGPVTARALDVHTVAMGRDDILIVARLGGAGTVAAGSVLAGDLIQATTLFTTEDPGFVDDPRPPVARAGGRIEFLRPGAIALRLGQPLAR